MSVERIGWYVERFRERGEAAFRAEFGDPILLARDNQETETEASFHTAFMSRKVLDAAMKGSSRQPDAQPLGVRAGEVRIIRKSAGAAFAERIGVGRARNADVHLPNPKVSKYHAFFERSEDGSYTLTDAGSRNGTWVREERLEAKAPVPLKDGDGVTFGPHRFLFYSPDAFVELVARRAAR